EDYSSGGYCHLACQFLYRYRHLREANLDVVLIVQGWFLMVLLIVLKGIMVIQAVPKVEAVALIQAKEVLNLVVVEVREIFSREIFPIVMHFSVD
ncbi:hypothetical protein HAX54_052097, partial [Datura stramonium]|nr:hypothetical protein [Datura stramonium]